jgi:hypothetical protein
MHVPKFDFSLHQKKALTPNFEALLGDIRDPDEATNNILLFLQSQSQIAVRQFKTSRNLILATIIIMIFQIGYAVWTNYESNSKQNSLTKIIDTQSQQTEVISRMSLSLLDLENQVRTLEQENARLNLKISSD